MVYLVNDEGELVGVITDTDGVLWIKDLSLDQQEQLRRDAKTAGAQLTSTSMNIN